MILGQVWSNIKGRLRSIQSSVRDKLGGTYFCFMQSVVGAWNPIQQFTAGETIVGL